MTMEKQAWTSLGDLLKRRLIFVGGKGGVGKSTLALALATHLARNGSKVLTITIQDPRFDPGEERDLEDNLTLLNVDPVLAFEEYAEMKIGLAPLTRVFVRNRLVRYLVQAAPGLPELFILGKIWHEREKYEHVVVDMPSSGYAIGMFNSTQNFSKLFSGGPIRNDALEMLNSFANSNEAGNLIVALPEEMPLIESLEMNERLMQMFPKNPAVFLVNKVFPQVNGEERNPSQWESPLAKDTVDYIKKRSKLETHNLRIWDQAGIQYSLFPYVPQADMETLLGHISGDAEENLA